MPWPDKDWQCWKCGSCWAVDNGAFSGFDADRFSWLLDRCKGRPGLMWVACPDVVGDAEATYEKFIEWKNAIIWRGLPLAYVAQDGQEDRFVPWSQLDAIFIGGTTEWKLGPGAADLMMEGKRQGKQVHMGRVNSMCRMELAFHQGADSTDGTAASMFGDKYIGKFCEWSNELHRRGSLFRPQRRKTARTYST